MGFLDKFLKTISTRYPDHAKLNRVMGKVKASVEKRHNYAQTAGFTKGSPEWREADRMYQQRADLYGNLIDKRNQMLTEKQDMGPALLKFLQKAATKENLTKGAAGLGLAGAGAYGGHKLTMEKLPESLLESLGLPGDLAEDVTSSIEDAYGYAEEHPIATAALLAPAGYGLSRAGGDIGAKIQDIGQGMMAERKRRRR